jgi:phospholipase C
MALVDKFVQNDAPTAPGCDPTKVMDYYDGNTVTALWNYAQHFSMSDNSFGTTFGPSHIGAINLISGNNHGLILSQPSAAIVDGTQIGNVEPTYDDCPVDPVNIHFTGRNIGDLLNARGISWGWFSDGSKPTSRLADGTPVCNETRNQQVRRHRHRVRQRQLAVPVLQVDVEPAAPTAHVGRGDQASGSGQPRVRHRRLLGRGPLDEQDFIAYLVNRLERLPSWNSTAVVIMYDDSDGAYDHVMPPILNDSQTVLDALTGPGLCGTGTPILGGYQGRCGHGPRLPFPDRLAVGARQPRRSHPHRPDLGDPLR